MDKKKQERTRKLGKAPPWKKGTSSVPKKEKRTLKEEKG